MRNFYQTLGILLFSMTFMLLQADLMGQTTINVPGDYATIQAAIDAADPGDVIEVGPGTYEENLTIDKALTLHGANNGQDCGSRGDESSIVSDGTGSAVVTIDADGVVFSGFEITSVDHRYAVNLSGTSDVEVTYNRVFDLGNDVTSGNVHSIVYIVPNPESNENESITISNNCFSNIGNTDNTGYSHSAIGVLQSTSEGTLTNLNIEDNVIDGVNSGTGNWDDGGRIAYGVLINVGGNSNFESNGKVVNATITGNEVSNLEGFISTGIGLEGNTDNAVVTGNTISYLTGHKVGNRAGGGYDLQALKFENNRYVGTVTVEHNSFQTNTFIHSDPAGVGYAVANYVPADPHGTAEVSCNWFGTADALEIADNEDMNGLVFSKEDAETTFIPFLVNDEIDNPDCSGQGPVSVYDGDPDDTGDFVSSHTTIQKGIDAANEGYFVVVEPGTYEENLTIDKALTLHGANAGQDCGSRGDESSIVSDGTGSAVVTIDADGVVFSGFEITSVDHRYAVNLSGTSDVEVTYNRVFDLGNDVPSDNVHSIVYIVPNPESNENENITISNNCFSNIGNTDNTGYSHSAIGVLQSTSEGTLTNLNIEDNVIDGVNSGTGNWDDGGRIAYGIQINTGGGNGFEDAGKVVNATIAGNEISNLEGFISTGIGLEGNTENAVVTGNTISNLTGHKVGNRAGGGYDLQALKFENNRYVGTVTVEQNSFQTNTFTHNDSDGVGYAVANYVPADPHGTAVVSCNWFGTADALEIADNEDMNGLVFSKEDAETTFIPFLVTDDIGNPDCSGQGPVSVYDGDPDNSGVFVSSHTTIQQGIDAANEGYFVVVEPGTYEENLTIDKALTLHGANAGQDCYSRGDESSIVSDGTGSAVVTIDADGVVFSGFEITSVDHRYAVNLSGTSDVEVTYNRVFDLGNDVPSDNVHSIVYIVPSPGSNENENITISNNCFSNIGNTDNTGYSHSAIGVLQSTSEGTLTNLNIEDNVIDGVNSGTGNWDDGGRIAYGIQINTGGGNGFEDDGKVVNATIAGNEISNLEGFISTGIGLEGNTENALVTGNTISNLTGHKVGNRAGGGYDLQALKFENNRYVGTVTVEHNSFQTNTFIHSDPAGVGYAVANYVPADPHGTAVVSCNWFGTADALEIADNEDMNGLVFSKEDAETTFIPFLVTDDIGNPDCSGQGPVSVYDGDPDNSGVFVSSHTTIQQGIDAANEGYFVVVVPGTYVEQLTIENSLSLEAESGAVLQAPDAGDRNTVSIPESSRTFDPIIFVDGDDEVIEVSISGFEIDGNEDPGSDSYMGVLARVADITIEGNSFHSMIGSQETVTIGLYNCNEILVHDNHITDFSRNAMTIVDATSNNVVVSENVIVGRGYVGTGFWAQNGIQLAGDFESEVTQNHLSDIGWEWPGSGTRWSSTGILLFDSGESLVVDNTLHNVQTGIHCNNGSFTADKNIYNMDDAGDLFDVIGIRANPEGRDVKAWPFDYEENGNASSSTYRSADFIWVITNNHIDGDIDASGFIVGLGIWPDEDGNSVEVTVENNIITNWSGAAIDIWNDDDFTASVINNFLANNNMAIENLTGTTISATCNWYGTADAGVIAASISGEVDFFPWLTDGTDTEPGEAGFTPVTGACDVEIFVQLDDSQNPNCPGGSDGSIDVTVSDGLAPYTFSWTGPDGFSSTDQNISGLSEGVYNLTVTDDSDPANTAVFSTELSDPLDEVEVTQVADMGPLCAGDQLEVSFDASGLGSSHTFEWTNDNTEIGPADGSGDIDFELTNSTSDAQTGTFSVVATSDLGCESDPMTFEVTVACATISGTIEELDGTAMVGVTVNMTGDDTQTTTTNANGAYTFDQAVGTNFVIEPDFNQVFTGATDLDNFGVNTNQSTKILNHLNGSEILSGKPLISADTRSTDNVTGADRAAIIVGLLGNPIAINFWNTQSWYFIEDGHVFNNPALPWDYASSIEVGGGNGDIEDIDFQGIRKGDITGAVAAVDDFYSGPSRSGNVVNMVMKERDLQPGQTVEVDVRFSDFESITSMQLAVEFDQNALELSEVIAGEVLSDFDGQNVGLYALNQGIIRIVWATSSDNAQTLGTDDVVFTLVFESNASEGSKLSEALGISESDISPLAFTDLAEMPIEAVFEEALSTGDLFGDGSQFAAVAQPNPFADRTSIQLNMPLAGQLEIEIYTADGRLVSNFTRDLPTGEAEVILDDQNIDGPGMYFIHLRAETGTAVLRVISTDR